MLLLLLLLLKSVEFDHAVALLLSVAGLVMRPHVTSESGYSLYCAFKWARVCPPNCRSPGELLAPSNASFLGADPSLHPAVSISFDSAILAQLLAVTNIHTDHAASVAVGRIYALSACDAA